MQHLESVLAHRDGDFARIRSALVGMGYSIGGGWTYDGGFFDRPLDDVHKNEEPEQGVHVRIPFAHVAGHLDAEAADVEATVRLGQPFVLRHIVRLGNDPTVTGGGVVSALINQFQSPANPDAPLSEEAITRARAWMARTDAHVQSALVEMNKH